MIAPRPVANTHAWVVVRVAVCVGIWVFVFVGVFGYYWKMNPTDTYFLTPTPTSTQSPHIRTHTLPTGYTSGTDHKRENPATEYHHCITASTFLPFSGVFQRSPIGILVLRS